MSADSKTDTLSKGVGEKKKVSKNVVSRTPEAKDKNTFEKEDLKALFNDNIDNILKNPRLNRDLGNSINELKKSNNSLIQAELKLTNLERGEKDTINKLNIGLATLQTAIIESKIATINSNSEKENLNNTIKKNESKINNLKSLLNNITDQFKALTTVTTQTRGGSISTNNSIRRQIFTDLKYITKYLKYKTKYIVFKSKH